MVGIVAGGGRTDKPLLKASRAKHKFAVKRNSWPKTRGVAMNPVDHPHGGGKFSRTVTLSAACLLNIVQVIINISVRRRPSRDMRYRDKRLVSLLPEELVCCVVLKRQRSKRKDGSMVACMLSHGVGYKFTVQDDSDCFPPTTCVSMALPNTGSDVLVYFSPRPAEPVMHQ